MQTSELVDLVQYIRKHKVEEQTTEVKAAAVDCPKRLYDTLSSFSNQDSGGVLVFGLNEKTGFNIVGVYDGQDLMKQVTEQCNQMQPPVRALFTFAEIEGKLVCSAEVPAIELSERPCYYRGAGPIKGAYVRVGDADLPMTDYELYSFEAYRKHLHDDERPVERSSIESLETDVVTKYIDKKSDERPGFAKLSESAKYDMMNILRGNNATLAAIMNFGIYPQGYFPQLCITAVVVPGTSIGDVDENNVRFIDNRRIEGTLPAMVDEAISFCLRNMKVSTIIDKNTGRREDKTEYPVEALREAILNAVIHRDYSVHNEGTPVQLDFFSDRVEIHSPGGLYGRMSVDQLGIAHPDQRNPALALMTESLTSAENRYSGIPTMRRAMKMHGLSEPVFENRRTEFVVTLYNKPIEREKVSDESRTEKVDIKEAYVHEDVNALLEFCKTPRTRKDIADYLKVKTVYYATERYVKPLVAAGKLAMTKPENPRSRIQRFFTIYK